MADIKVTVHVADNVNDTIRSIKIGQLYDLLKPHTDIGNRIDSVNKKNI